MLVGWMDAVYIPTVCPPCHPSVYIPAVYSVQVYSRGDQIRQLSQLELAGQAVRTVLRCKVAALQEAVAGLEAHLVASTYELAATRSGPRKAVNGWSTERAVLVRKLHMRCTMHMR